MRIALVSPYSYTYPGGVGRHVEALSDRFLGDGHDVRILCPYDPDDRLSLLLHSGARPQRRPLTEHLVPLGRTIGLPANGAVSNISVSPAAVATLGNELRHGGFDVVHVHEPNAPVLSWFATEAARTAVVTTYHTYDPRRLVGGLVAHGLGARRVYNKAHVRIAVSEAARWTAERFYGGRYRIIPNGVDLAAAAPVPKPARTHLELLFVGRADERKGLPVLLHAFEALRRAGVNARLTVAGASRQEAEPYLIDTEDVEFAGRVSEDEKWRLLREADVLCAPSLGGESFGMVLTEAFAAGTPVVCSDIAGYRDVVRDGVDGLLVQRGEPARLGESLHALALDPARRARMSAAALERARRFGWESVATEVMVAYEDAIEMARSPRSLAVRFGLRPADGLPAVPPQRALPPVDPPDPRARRRTAAKLGRRLATGSGMAIAAALALLAVQRIGLRSIGQALVSATPTQVLVALGLMCAAMFVRAESWHAILRAALPDAPVRRRDAVRGLMIGVLMSATLPARLGEPSRALIMARRLGRARERLPAVLATILSQTLLNVVALATLGIVMFTTVGVFKGHDQGLVLATIVPVLLVALALARPTLLRVARSSGPARGRELRRLGRTASTQLRAGVSVFAQPRLGGAAAALQLLAWGLQWLACYMLLVALGLDHQAGLGAAAAVLFAVNLTSALPATPANIGVFQAACVAVLSAYGVGHTSALAYGIILQAVEVATAIGLGMPALVGEGVSWREMRLRALNATPAELTLPKPDRRNVARA